VPMAGWLRLAHGVGHGEARAAAQSLRPEGALALKERRRGAGLGCPRF